LRKTLFPSAMKGLIVLVTIIGVANPAQAATTVIPTIDIGTIETNVLTPAFSVNTTQVTVGSPTEYHLRNVQFTPADWVSEICPGALTAQPLSACGATLYKDGVSLTNVTITKSAGSGTMTIMFPPADYPAGWLLPAGTTWKLEFVAAAFRTTDSVGATISFNQGGNVWVDPPGTWGGPAQLDYASRSYLQNHVVTFDANGGVGILERQLARSDTALTSNSSNITREGFTFAGWATSEADADAGIVAYLDGAIFPFRTAQGPLYAVWTGGPSSTEELAATGFDSSTSATPVVVAFFLVLVAVAIRRKSSRLGGELIKQRA
jgi:hypothetical protein